MERQLKMQQGGIFFFFLQIIEDTDKVGGKEAIRSLGVCFSNSVPSWACPCSLRLLKKIEYFLVETL